MTNLLLLRYNCSSFELNLRIFCATIEQKLPTNYMVDFKSLKNEVLSVLSLEEFEECDLLNMTLIAILELTEDQAGINYPHPYTIARFINEILGKNTRLRRGTEKKSMPVENEGVKEEAISKLIKLKNNIPLFASGMNSTEQQQISDSPKKMLSGYGLNPDNIINRLETACLNLYIQSKKSEGSFSSKKIGEAIDQCIEAFHKETSTDEREDLKQKYKNIKIRLLVEANYFKESADGTLSPGESRSAIERNYLKYLVKKSIKKIEVKSPKYAENLQELLNKY